MQFESPLNRLSSPPSELPDAVTAEETLKQARIALKAGKPDVALSRTQQAIARIEKGKTREGVSSPCDESNQWVEASLWGMTAMALHAVESQSNGQASESAVYAFDIAERSFTSLLSCPERVRDPYITDYCLMLAAFGDYRHAFEVLQKPEVQAVIAGDAYQAVGLGLRKTGDLKSAIDLLRKAASTSPSSEVFFELGTDLRESGDDQHAFEAFLQAARLGLTSNVPTAAQAVAEAVRLHPDSKEARWILATLHQNSGNYGAAAEELQNLVGLSPNDPEMRVALASALIRKEEPHAALEHLKKALEIDSTSWKARWLQGEAQILCAIQLIDQDKQDEAQTWLKNALDNLTIVLRDRPKSADCLRSRGIASWYLGTLQKSADEGSARVYYEHSVHDLNAAVAERPDDNNALGWLGESLFALGNLEQALHTVNRVLVLLRPDARNPEKAWLFGLKGLILLSLRLSDEATASLQAAIQAGSRGQRILEAYDSVLEQKRDWTARAQFYCEMQSWEGYENYYQHWRKQEIMNLRSAGSYNDALKALDREPPFPLNDPDDPQVAWLRARLLADIGDFEEARNALPEKLAVQVREIYSARPGTQREALDLFSLRGWILQNCEPRDETERAQLAEEGCRVYRLGIEEAAKLAAKDPQLQMEDAYVRKGFANALLRWSGREVEAEKQYRSVIEFCEQQTGTSVAPSNWLCLLGWCYYNIQEYAAACQYYEAARNMEEIPAPSEFDYALALLASGHERSIDTYEAALRKIQSKEALRRTGVIRVALHDIREFLFEEREIKEPKQFNQVQQRLCGELRVALEQLPSNVAAFAQRIRSFLLLLDKSLW